MRKTGYFSIAIILSSLLIISCSKNEDHVKNGLSEDINVETDFKSMNALHLVAYNAMMANGLNQAVYFVDTTTKSSSRDGIQIPSGPQGFILTEGTFPYFTSFGGFAAIGGSGDFIRLNPDGTATLQVNSNEAEAFYTDQSVFPFKEYEGFGQMHMHHTGQFYVTPLPNGTLLYLVATGGHGAATWHGQADVLEVNTSGPEYKFKAEYRIAGNGKVIQNSLVLK